MNHPQHIAKHLQDVHFGGNWTWSNLNDVLADVDWQQATKQLHDLNTIAKLTFHIHYFVAAVLSVLEGNPLEAHDKYSFDVPPINSQEDWDKLRTKALKDAKKAAALIEQLPENKLWDTFVLEKYGNYYRNLNGLIEHTHYHLGQIALIKKLILAQQQ